MQEALLHYIWKNSLFIDQEYIADTGEKIRILERGTHNHDAGPDFINAKIEIEGTVWAGNVEIHLNASDWTKHGHHKDQAYNNVILHVTSEPDSSCFTAIGRKVPCIPLQPENSVVNSYYQLINENNIIACHASLQALDKSLISFWLSALTIERLQTKTTLIENLLKITNNSWEEAFYVHLSRSFGFKINALPFELLARATPLKIISKHSNNLSGLESLLFGQAGLLNHCKEDGYSKNLSSEYAYLKKKYQLTGIDGHLWKFLRLRPSNFPTIRIAELCSLIFNSKKLFSKTLDCNSVEQIHLLYNCSTSEYWKTHYNFGLESKKQDKMLGTSSINSLLINTIIPFMFVYSHWKNIPELKEKAIFYLENLPAENNTIIRKWIYYNLVPDHAANSQAFIQLTNNYCKTRRCLECKIGNLVLKKKQI